MSILDYRETAAAVAPSARFPLSGTFPGAADSLPVMSTTLPDFGNLALTQATTRF
ncbi:hypothetical protein D187_007886 [Cystobacter fuscus DSM 2262]|uniref:Uncharacterized protein n=1 Tax=Cystobacter fuscus (strain ATCC 25194 / DSM 2262 / NBRC 100088 / M29) TaxID=1242864 RepID=S9Q5E4_CYSF2|nr:hypothetical protein D187_007886 [Cystobacter fuscus DSM 2262]